MAVVLLVINLHWSWKKKKQKSSNARLGYAWGMHLTNSTVEIDLAKQTFHGTQVGLVRRFWSRVFQPAGHRQRPGSRRSSCSRRSTRRKWSHLRIPTSRCLSELLPEKSPGFITLSTSDCWQLRQMRLRFERSMGSLKPKIYLPSGISAAIYWNVNRIIVKDM